MTVAKDNSAEEPKKRKVIPEKNAPKKVPKYSTPTGNSSQAAKKWQRIQVEETNTVYKTPRPSGLCLIPWHPNRPIYGGQQFLLEDVETKELSEPYDLTFCQFKESIKPDGTLRRNGTRYRVYCSCKAGNNIVQEGDSIFVKTRPTPTHYTADAVEYFPTFVLHQIFRCLDCLDIVCATLVCKYWWNAAASCEHAQTMLEAAPTVNGYKELLQKFQMYGFPCSGQYIRQSLAILTSEFSGVGAKAPKITEEHKMQQDYNYDISCFTDEPGTWNNRDSKIEKRRKDRIESDNTQNYNDTQVRTIEQAQFPVDMLECYKLHNGAQLGSDTVFQLYFAPLEQVARDTNDVIFPFTTQAGGYRKSLTYFAREGEFSSFYINIDYNDPCFGHVYVYVCNCPELRRCSLSFSDFIYGLVTLARDANGLKRLQNGAGSVSDLDYIFPEKRKWAPGLKSELELLSKKSKRYAYGYHWFQ